jgi:hypothetical protein
MTRVFSLPDPRTLPKQSSARRSSTLVFNSDFRVQFADVAQLDVRQEHPLEPTTTIESVAKVGLRHDGSNRDRLPVLAPGSHTELGPR